MSNFTLLMISFVLVLLNIFIFANHPSAIVGISVGVSLGAFILTAVIVIGG